MLFVDVLQIDVSDKEISHMNTADFPKKF